jgi:hypothetical protein
MRNHIKTQYEWFLAILTNTDPNLLICHTTAENCKKSGQIHNWAIEGVDVSNMINMQRGDNFDENSEKPFVLGLNMVSHDNIVALLKSMFFINLYNISLSSTAVLSNVPIV